VNGLVSGLVHGKRIGKSPISGSRFKANRESGIASPVSPFFWWGVPDSRFSIADWPGSGSGNGPSPDLPGPGIGVPGAACRVFPGLVGTREFGSRAKTRQACCWLHCGMPHHPATPQAKLGSRIRLRGPSSFSPVTLPNQHHVDSSVDAQAFKLAWIWAPRETPFAPGLAGHGDAAEPQVAAPAVVWRDSAQRTPSSGPNMTAGHRQVRAARRLLQQLKVIWTVRLAAGRQAAYGRGLVAAAQTRTDGRPAPKTRSAPSTRCAHRAEAASRQLLYVDDSST
jgi:hypothetical protein